jgi:hypothetical protein
MAILLSVMVRAAASVVQKTRTADPPAHAQNIAPRTNGKFFWFYFPSTQYRCQASIEFRSRPHGSCRLAPCELPADGCQAPLERRLEGFGFQRGKHSTAPQTLTRRHRHSHELCVCVCVLSLSAHRLHRNPDRRHLAWLAPLAFANALRTEYRKPAVTCVSFRLPNQLPQACEWPPRHWANLAASGAIRQLYGPTISGRRY